MRHVLSLGLTILSWTIMPAYAADPLAPGSGAADAAIERNCQYEWPSDYSMRVYCEQRQRAAMRELQEPIYDVIPRIADVIRMKCARDWPENFAMRVHCQKRQIEGAKKLANP